MWPVEKFTRLNLEGSLLAQVGEENQGISANPIYLKNAHENGRSSGVCSSSSGSAWGGSTPSPPSPLSIHFLIYCSFLLFPFSFSHVLYLFSSFVHPFPFFLPESSHSISRLEVVGGDRIWLCLC